MALSDSELSLIRRLRAQVGGEAGSEVAPLILGEYANTASAGSIIAFTTTAATCRPATACRPCARSRRRSGCRPARSRPRGARSPGRGSSAGSASGRFGSPAIVNSPR